MGGFELLRRIGRFTTGRFEVLLGIQKSFFSTGCFEVLSDVQKSFLPIGRFEVLRRFKRPSFLLTGRFEVLSDVQKSFVEGFGFLNGLSGIQMLVNVLFGVSAQFTAKLLVIIQPHHGIGQCFGVFTRHF